jgi:hypothetical protein
MQSAHYDHRDFIVVATAGSIRLPPRDEHVGPAYFERKAKAVNAGPVAPEPRKPRTPKPPRICRVCGEPIRGRSRAIRGAHERCALAQYLAARAERDRLALARMRES